MIQILLLPNLPQVVEASLEDLAFGLPKLSALGLPMLHLHHFGDLFDDNSQYDYRYTFFRLTIGDFAMSGDCPYFHSKEYRGSAHNLPSESTSG